SAQKYGQLEIITSGVINPFSIDRLTWSIAPKLADFTDDDYLLLTGPGTGYILATTILLRNHDSIKCLRYETSTRTYEEVIVSKEIVRNIFSGSVPEVYGMPGRIY